MAAVNLINRATGLIKLREEALVSNHFCLGLFRLSQAVHPEDWDLLFYFLCLSDTKS